MTSNSDTLRSLCLAALMVLSVFAGTVALSGSGAAASDASIVSLTNAADDNGNDIPDVPGGTTVQHTLTYDIDNVSADGDTDTISVTIPAGSYESLDNLTVTNRASGQAIPVTGSPELSNNGRTASFDISPDAGGSVDIQVEVQFTANWPAVTQPAAGPVNTSVTDSANSDITNSTLATVEILDGGVAPEGTTALNSGDTFYTGQDVYVEGLSSGEEYRVREVDDGDVDTLRQTLTADGDGAIDFELSAGLSDGDFVLVDSDGSVIPVDDGVAQPAQSPGETNVNSAAFEVIAMDLTAEFDDASVDNEGGSTTVDYEIESDVRNGYTVNVSAQGDLDVDDFEDIFGGDATIVTTYEDDDTIEITQSGSDTAEGTYELDFDDIDAGTYTFEANVTDADASDSDDIDVAETGDPSAEFSDSIYSNQRGDVVNISVEMSNTDVATLQVGDVDDSGYAVVAEVEDDDDDGVAYVEFNSFTAGNDTTTTLTAGDDDTSVSNVTNPDDSFDGNSPLGSNLLDTGDYNMYVVEGEKDSPEIDSSDADASATLQLSDPSVEGLQIWTAPDESLDELRDADAEDIPAWANAGNLTQTDTIARNDTLVVQVEASGLEGALETGDATTVYNATSATSQLLNLTFEPDSGALNQEDDGAVNIADIGAANYDVVYDGANDAHYVVIDSAALTEEVDYEDGDEYTANFSVFEEETDLFDEDISVTQDFAIEDPELELDANADDEIILEAAAGQEVTGTTNLAPGTEVEVSIDSDTSTDPFVKRPTADVQANGSYTAVADFSDNSAGSEFTVQAFAEDIDSDEYDGELVAATGGGQTPTDGTVTEETPGTTEETPGMTEETSTDPTGETPGDGAGETPADGTTAGSGPGFTAALALVALLAAALLAARRND